MSVLLDIPVFLEHAEKEKLIIVDARSENEYLHAHIPGAVNIPLLNNENRHLVGIEYKKKGREAAISLGFELVGPFFHEFIKKANKLSSRKEILIYCWRGGMRSSILSWVLSMSGYKTFLLRGGYKSFRNFALSQFSVPRKIAVLGGHTGCGKTEALKELRLMGEQVVDLEELACHKGSAFGGLGMKPQPSNEHFENMLGLSLSGFSDDKVLWVEAESHAIGKVKIPDEFFNQMQKAPLIEIIAPLEVRINRILKEYGIFPRESLAECTTKLQKRLGGKNLGEALQALDEFKYKEWIEILLNYYDKTYLHSMNDRNPVFKESVSLSESEEMKDVAERLILASKNYNENIVL